MAAIDIVITGAALSPNPVGVGKQYIISVEIVPAVHVLGDDACRLSDSDGAYISAPDSTIYALKDYDGTVIVDDDNGFIENMEG